MTVQTHHITVSDKIYRQLQSRAQVVKLSVSELAQQVLAQELSVHVEDDLPIHVQNELRAMASLSDSALWQIAESRMNADKEALYDLMLERLQSNTLTSEGRKILTQLRGDGDLLALRKAHAYSILKKRGHALPTLQEMRTAVAE